MKEYTTEEIQAEMTRRDAMTRFGRHSTSSLLGELERRSETRVKFGAGGYAAVKTFPSGVELRLTCTADSNRLWFLNNEEAKLLATALEEKAAS